MTVAGLGPLVWPRTLAADGAASFLAVVATARTRSAPRLGPAARTAARRAGARAVVEAIILASGCIVLRFVCG